MFADGAIVRSVGSVAEGTLEPAPPARPVGGDITPRPAGRNEGPAVRPVPGRIPGTGPNVLQTRSAGSRPARRRNRRATVRAYWRFRQGASGAWLANDCRNSPRPRANRDITVPIAVSVTVAMSLYDIPSIS